MTLFERFGRFYHSPDRGHREVARRISAGFSQNPPRLPRRFHAWMRVCSAVDMNDLDGFGVARSMATSAWWRPWWQSKSNPWTLERGLVGYGDFGGVSGKWERNGHEFGCDR